MFLVRLVLYTAALRKIEAGLNNNKNIFDNLENIHDNKYIYDLLELKCKCFR